MTSPSLHDLPDAIRNQARSWVAALADPEVSAEERLAFDEWLGADDRHGEAYKASLQAYALIGDVRDNGVTPVRGKATPQSRAPWIAAAGLALAASLALALFIPTAPAPLRPDFATG